jgi:putative transcriptional regulator
MIDKKTPFAELAKGSCLIASPEIDNGIYFRSVILICEHTSSGSFGLIINKPIDIDLPEDLTNLNTMANERVEIRTGGPVQPSHMMLLHSSRAHGEISLKILDGIYLGGDMQFLQEVVNDVSGPHVRLCFGYTGWDAGSLEREFLSGNWFLAPGSYYHVFETPADKVWQTILREMGGKYATISMIPDDLSLN